MKDCSLEDFSGVFLILCCLSGVLDTPQRLWLAGCQWLCVHHQSSGQGVSRGGLTPVEAEHQPCPSDGRRPVRVSGVDHSTHLTLYRPQRCRWASLTHSWSQILNTVFSHVVLSNFCRAKNHNSGKPRHVHRGRKHHQPDLHYSSRLYAWFTHLLEL